MLIKRDPNGAAGGASTSTVTDTTPKFDAEAFKTDLMNSNKSLITEAMGNMRSMLEENLKPKEVEASNDGGKQSPIMNEFSDEMARLGIKDPDQADALMSFMTKAMNKNSPDLEGKIIKKVDENNAWTQKKGEHDQEAIGKFPDITNSSSSLFKSAQQIYSSMSPALQKEPDAMSIAVHRAANKLGIQPTAPVEQVYGNNAGNPTIGVNGRGNNREANSADLEFAKSFGVNQESFQRRFKEVQSKRQ